MAVKIRNPIFSYKQINIKENLKKVKIKVLS